MRMGIIVLLVIVAAAAAFVFTQRESTFLRFAPLPGPVTVIRDVPYVPGGGHKQQLDLYLPQGKTGVPMVLFVHGGYWTEGDRDYLEPITGLYGSIGRTLAARGIATAVTSYRLVPAVTVDKQVEDVRSAFLWLKDHAAEHGGDPERVFLMGHSAGAHIVNILTADPTFFSAVGRSQQEIRGTITLSGIVDLVHMRDANDAAWNRDHTFLVFGTEESSLVRYTPGTHVSPSTPPFLALLGERDFPWLFPETEATVAKLRSVGHEPEFIVIPGNRHMDMVLKMGARGDNVTERVVQFIERLK